MNTIPNRVFPAVLVLGAWSAVLSAAEPLPVGKEYVNSIGMKLVRIEPGEFMMGAGEAPPRTQKEWLARDWDEAPAHQVKIARPFYVGVHEVSNTQYERFDPERKKLGGKGGATQADDEPVNLVTWQQAMDFCPRTVGADVQRLEPRYRLCV